MPGRQSPSEVFDLLNDLLDRFQPAGPSEEALVLRIANLQWRLDRAFPAEAGIYRDRFHDVAKKDELRQHQYATKSGTPRNMASRSPPSPTPPVEGDLLARAFNVDCEGSNSFTRLARYETSIERSIDRCLRQLKMYPAARMAEPPPPADTTPADPPTNPKPESEPKVPPAQSAETRAEPIATPSNSANLPFEPNK